MSTGTKAGAVVLAAALIWILWFVFAAEESPAPASPETTSRQAPAPEWTDWPVWRGDRALSGVTDAHLAEKPALLWSFAAEAAVKSSPVVAGGHVFFGSNDSKVYCLAMADGRKVWEANTGSEIEAPPLYIDDRIYVGALDGTFLALDAATGKEVWRYEAGGTISGSANWARGPDASYRILVGCQDSFLYCLDAATGAEVWKHETGSYILGGVAIEGSIAVVGSCDAQIHVVNTEDGATLEAIDVGAFVTASVALSEMRGFVGTHGGEFVSFDAGTGETVWVRETSEEADAIASSAAVATDRVVFGARDKRLYCLSTADGGELWTFAAKGDVDSSPVVCGSKVVFGSDDGRVYVVTFADGQEVWSYDLGSPVTTSPAVTGDAFVVGSEDGKVFAFGSSSGGSDN